MPDGIGDLAELVGLDEELIAVSSEGNDDQPAPSRSATSKRKRQKRSFPWEYTHDWQEGDALSQRGKRQCTQCRVWFSSTTNASGWKRHLDVRHSVKDSDNASTAPFGKLVQTTLSVPPAFAPSQLRVFENAVVDYVIQGGVTLRAAGGDRFKKFVDA
jgi:hypothetical protein